MISTRLRAALLTLKTSAGYRPGVYMPRCRIGRTVLCATPFTVSVFVTSGNAVGMPPLRWCVCQLIMFTGMLGTCGMMFPVAGV